MILVFKKGYKFSQGHRRNLSKAHKGIIVSEETRRKLSLAGKGRPAWNKGKKGYTNSGSFKKGHKLSEEAIEKRRQQLIGKKNPFYGKTHSEETKRRIGKANRGRIKSKETRRKMSLASTGRIVSEKTRRKISNFHKGKVVSEETKKKRRITIAKRYPDGLKPSEETRRRMSKARKGRIVSEKTRRKLRGRIVSEETREKLRLLGTGRKHSEKSKRKIRKARARQVISEEHMRNFKNSMKGRKHSEESKRRMSKAQKGKIFSEKHRRKIREARARQIFTKETRRRMSESTKGHKHSKETRRKIGESQKGKIISEETRRKIRKGQGWKKISEESKQKQKARTPRGKKHGMYGKTHTEEVRKILRESRLHQVIPLKDNKFESSVQAKLREKRIKFEKHKPILGQPDLFIKPNICVFLDGDFHHAHPSRYSDDAIIWKERISSSGRHRPVITAKMIRLKDKRVRKKLRAEGYKIIAFWWSEWKKNPEKCLQKIIKIIKESRR